MATTLISEREYISRRGNRYLLMQEEDDRAREPFPRVYWTYRYSNGMYPGLGRLHNYHLTVEAAIERIEQQETIDAALAAVPKILGRTEYEALAVRYGFTPLRDDGLLYIADWGEFALPECTVEQIIIANIHRRRGQTYKPEHKRRQTELEAERLAALAKHYAGRQHQTCQHCGQSGYVGEYPFSTNPASGLCDDCH
jgi:hypothetical protein